MSSAYDDMVSAMDNAASGLPAASGGGGGFLSGLSGILGAGGPVGGLLGSLGGLMGGPDAALQPDNNTVDGRQNLAVTFANAFQVGGKGNSADGSPGANVSPIDSTKTATGTGGPANQSLLWIISAAVLGLLLIIFAAGGRRS